MFPTFPSRAGQEKRRRLASPNAPIRGDAPRLEGGLTGGIFGRREDVGAGFSLRVGEKRKPKKNFFVKGGSGIWDLGGGGGGVVKREIGFFFISLGTKMYITTYNHLRLSWSWTGETDQLGWIKYLPR